MTVLKATGVAVAIVLLCIALNGLWVALQERRLAEVQDLIDGAGAGFALAAAWVFIIAILNLFTRKRG